MQHDIHDSRIQSELNQAERRKLIQELAGAVSTQAQVVNRMWLALMTVVLFGVLPRLPGKNGNVTMPFSLGEVDPAWFYSVVFALLVVLIIAFAAAHAQQVRAQKLAQAAVDSIILTQSIPDYVHPREWFDMCRLPSINRVAPLAQSIRGKYQFYTGKQDCPAWLRLISVAYYGLLKAAAMIVYFGLPLWALWWAYLYVSPPFVGLRYAFLFAGS